MDNNPQFVSLELESDKGSYFQSIVGTLRWMTELRSIDIITKVSSSSSHLALPREGHLNATAHVIANIGQKYNSRLVYILKYPEIDYSVFRKCDWSEICQDAKVAVSVNVTEQQEKEIYISTMT